MCLHPTINTMSLYCLAFPLQGANFAITLSLHCVSTKLFFSLFGIPRYIARQRWIWALDRVCQLVRRRKRKQFEIMSQRATDRYAPCLGDEKSVFTIATTYGNAVRMRAKSLVKGEVDIERASSTKQMFSAQNRTWPYTRTRFVLSGVDGKLDT